MLDCRTLITNSQKQRNEYLTTIREHQFAGNYQNGIPKSGNLSIAVDYRKPIANLMPLQMILFAERQILKETAKKANPDDANMDA